MPRSPFASVVTLPEIPETDPRPGLLDFFITRFPRISRFTWEQRFKDHKIHDSFGNPVSIDTPYIPGAQLFYYRETDQEPRIPFQEEILFNNNEFMVVCKPHFLPVVPSGPYVKECLLNRLKLSTGNPNLVPANRIDRETAGLVLFSSNKKNRGRYQALFMEAKIKKLYEAVVHCLTPTTCKQMLIQNRIEKASPWFRNQIVPGEPNSSTLFKINHFAGNKAFASITPETGKKHQIRIHLSSAGYPIVNDRLYPVLLEKQTLDFKNPLQLLAKELAFKDPVSGLRYHFVSKRSLAWPPQNATDT